MKQIPTFKEAMQFADELLKVKHAAMATVYLMRLVVIVAGLIAEFYSCIGVIHLCELLMVPSNQGEKVCFLTMLGALMAGSIIVCIIEFVDKKMKSLIRQIHKNYCHRIREYIQKGE